MRTIITLTIVALCTVIGHSQLEVKPAIGMNFTNVSKDPESGSSSGKIGWQVGGSVLYGTKFYGEIGVFYLQKTTEFSSNDIEELNFDKKTNGIRIPVNVGLHVLGSEESLAALRVFGGGSGYFVTSVSGGELDKEDINSPQWGVHAGLGLDIWILFLEWKYEWSLTDVTSLTDFNVGQYRGSYINLGARFQF